MNAVPACATSLLLLAAACGLETGASSSALEQEACGHHAGAIVDADGQPIGNIVVSNDSANLIIDVHAAEGRALKRYYLYAGTDPVPANSSGYVYETSFPYQELLPEPWPGSTTITVPLSELGVAENECGQLTIALYTVMVQLDDNGNILRKRNGWAYGPDIFPHGKYATGFSFTYEICCEPPPEEEGCTLTQGYWKNHNEYARGKKNRIPWPAPYDADDLLCGERLIDILRTPTRGDGWTILAHQAIAAQLNIAAGATAPDQVADALDEAMAILETCEHVHANEAPEAINLAGILDAYNNGHIGPGHCE